MFELIHLVMIFVFLTVLLLITTIYSKVWWGVKAFLIVFSLFFYISAYDSISSLLGRPTSQEIADESRMFLFLAEPPRGNFKGRIVYLVRDDVDYRLHVRPYNQDEINMLREQRRKGAAGGVQRKMIIDRSNKGADDSRGDFNLRLVDPVIPTK